MSVEEIIAELPKLDPVELQLVFQHVVDIRENTKLEISPELSKAIDEALAVPEEDCLSIEEVRRLVKTWNSK